MGKIAEALGGVQTETDDIVVRNPESEPVAGSEFFFSFGEDFVQEDADPDGCGAGLFEELNGFFQSQACIENVVDQKDVPSRRVEFQRGADGQFSGTLIIFIRGDRQSVQLKRQPDAS